MNGLTYREGSWTESSTGRAYQYRWWRPQASRAALILLHGLGEHGGRYQALVPHLAEQGVFVAIPDLWGHGRSGGRRGDLGELGVCMRHLQQMTDQVFLPASNQRTYALFGHSFGGLAAIVWALDGPEALRRLVVQSPLLEVGFPLPRWKTAAARWLATWWPTFMFAMRLDAGGLSHDPAVVQGYRDDPLVHGSLSARTYRSMIRARDEAIARAGTLRTPVLMLCGTADRVVSLEVAQRWFDLVPCEKRRVLFPTCYHELHHEAVLPQVARETLAWILPDA